MLNAEQKKTIVVSFIIFGWSAFMVTLAAKAVQNDRDRKTKEQKLIDNSTCKIYDLNESYDSEDTLQYQ